MCSDTVYMNGEAMKNDTSDNKPPLDFLRMDGVEEMCRVMAFGAAKYERNNYLKGHKQTKLLGAALRHILAYNQGEDLDQESGLTHIAHAQACLFMLQVQKSLGASQDDRD